MTNEQRAIKNRLRAAYREGFLEGREAGRSFRRFLEGAHSSPSIPTAPPNEWDTKEWFSTTPHDAPRSGETK